MKTQIKFNRRSFIKTSAVAGGGMVLSFNWFASCTTAETVQVPSAWFDVNAFLKIADTGHVTIMSPNPEIGQGVKTSMPMIVAEELDVDWKDVIVEQAPFDSNKYTRQVAGGSQSLRKGWEGLRMAGATARKMLVNAAAKQWEVDPAECTTASGKIMHKASGKSIGYGEIAATAGEMEVPEEVELKDIKDFKIIGKGKRNVDNQSIVTGEPLFGLDTKREGMLIAMAAFPPAFGMKLKSVDDSAAKAMPGVVDVVSFENYVAVVGKTTWEVKKGRDALVVEWEAEGDLENTAGHDADMLAAMTKKTDEPMRRDGNPESAFKNAATVIEKTYEVPFLAHNTMEPMNFFAHVKDGKAELLGPIQTPEWTRGRVAKALEFEDDAVSIMLTRMGGGFGRRLYGDFAIEAAQISQKVNAPIQLVYTREDDMTKGMYRPALKSTYKAALDAEGNLTAFHVRGAGVNGRAVRPNNFPASAIENYLAENHNVESKITTAAWRAPVHNFVGFAEQAFLDELAMSMEKDPVQFRLELLEKAKAAPVGELEYDPARFMGVINLAAEKCDWKNPKEGVHRGFAAYYSHNSYVAEVAEVVMENNRPRVTKVYCAVDCGIVVNPLGALNQIEGGVIDGMGHSMYSALTFKDGKPEQSNFNNYKLIRFNEAPEIETHFVENNENPTGLGEPTLPPVGGAIANAIHAATGIRLTKQPFMKEVELLG